MVSFREGAAQRQLCFDAPASVEGAHGRRHAGKATRSGIGPELVPRADASQREEFAAAYGEEHVEKDTASVLGPGMVPTAEGSRKEEYLSVYGEQHLDKDTASVLGPNLVPLSSEVVEANKNVLSKMEGGCEIVLAMHANGSSPLTDPIDSATERLSVASLGRAEVGGPISEWEPEAGPARSTAQDAYRHGSADVRCSGSPRRGRPAGARPGSHCAPRQRLDPASLPAAGLSPAAARAHSAEMSGYDVSRQRCRDAAEEQVQELLSPAARGVLSPDASGRTISRASASQRQSSTHQNLDPASLPAAGLSPAAARAHSAEMSGYDVSRQRCRDAAEEQVQELLSPAARGVLSPDASGRTISRASASQRQSSTHQTYGWHSGYYARAARSNIGVWTGGDHVHVLLPRHAAAPCEATAAFATTRDNQREVCVAVMQGARPRASENALMLNADVRVPPAPAGAQHVEITLRLDKEERLHVRAGVAGATSDALLWRETADGTMVRVPG